MSTDQTKFALLLRAQDELIYNDFSVRFHFRVLAWLRFHSWDRGYAVDNNGRPVRGADCARALQSSPAQVSRAFAWLRRRGLLKPRNGILYLAAGGPAEAAPDPGRAAAAVQR